MATIDIALIQQLRNQTGLGMMDCKKALQESDGDIDKAIEILRKKGASIAAKRSGNATSEGLVHAYIHPGSTLGVLVELNCETDFVARNETLRQFAHDLGMHIAAFKPLFVSADQVDETFLSRERDIIKEQLASSGKPEKMMAQIIEGKLQRIYSEICLMDQPFIKNDQMTVSDVLKDIIGKLGENIKIRRFARFEVGS